MGEGVLVVVVDEAAGADLNVEEPPDARGAEDALGGSPDLGWVFEPAVTDPAFQGQQIGLGAGDELGGAQGVSSGSGVGFHHHGAGPVAEDDVCGPAAMLGDLDAGGVIVDGFEGFTTDAVTVQPGGQHVIKPGVGHHLHVGR